MTRSSGRLFKAFLSMSDLYFSQRNNSAVFVYEN